MALDCAAQMVQLRRLNHILANRAKLALNG